MALGRGLEDILLEVEEAYERDLSSVDSFDLEAQGVHIESIAVKDISPNPFQPRKHFDEKALQELSGSIAKHGLLQPIVVIEKENGYLLVAGERRLRAHELANITSIKAIIADVDIDEVRLRELSLIENIQREDLNAIELANSYAELIDVHKITHDELSLIVYKSRSQITNTMRLLTLSSYVQKHLIDGDISQGHAKVLVGIDEKKQKRIIDSIIGQKLSVRDAEKIAKSYKSGSLRAKSDKNTANLLEKYKEELYSLLPFDYKIKSKSLEINFRNEKDIKSFLSFFKKSQ